MSGNCSGSCSEEQVILTRIDGEDYRGEAQIDYLNKRMIVQKYQGVVFPLMIFRNQIMALSKGLGKIIYFARNDLVEDLEYYGYQQEGIVPAFYDGAEARCYVKYLDDARSVSPHLEQEDEIIAGLREVARIKGRPALAGGFSLRVVGEADLADLTSLFKDCFVSYPSPLFEQDYIRGLLSSGAVFVGAFAGPMLVSAASAHVDVQNKNAEITDCATRADYRGQGLLTALLDLLEQELGQRRLGVLYSLARAGSVGMNVSLHKLGYTFSGRLLNNCHIAGRFEDMNLWVKLPQARP